MSSLKRQIKIREKSLIANYSYIRRQSRLLRRKFTLTHLFLMMTAGLVVGYLLSRHKQFKSVIYQFLIVPLKLARFVNSMQTFFIHL